MTTRSRNVIDLRSDTVTRPTPAMRKAMAEAEVGDDVFGEDPTANALQEKVAKILGKETSIFVPSGTMANQLAIKSHTQPGDEVIIEATGHPYILKGAQALPFQEYSSTVSEEHEVFSIPLRSRRPSDGGPSLSSTRLICLENTHNRGGGSIYPPKR